MPKAEAFRQATRASHLDDFKAAARCIQNVALRTPLIPFAGEAGAEIRLKVEVLQPLGSFKVRCGTNALSGLSDDELSRGVATVSAGNFAQGLAIAARVRGAKVTAHVQEGANPAKLAVLRELGVTIVPQAVDAWMHIAMSCETGADDGYFIHPVCNANVIRGNGTIALEIFEDWPEVDTVVVPVGGGGLIVGIALAFRALGRPVRVIACEAQGAAPLAAAKLAGRPVLINREPSFIDAVGSPTVLDAMWPLLDELVDDVIVVPVADVKTAVRQLFERHHLVVEGAGALGFAAGVAPRLDGRKAAVVLSGGNIDPRTFARILTE